jgi:hypothetical protein
MRKASLPQTNHCKENIQRMIYGEDLKVQPLEAEQELINE